MLKEYLSTLANTFREKLGTTEKINAQSFPDKVSEVYDAGKQAEKDAFWDDYQRNGERTDYSHAFSGEGWTTALFTPKYDMIITGSAYGMFWNSDISGDLEEILDKLGVKIDLSHATQYNYLFSGAENITKLGEINVECGTSIISAFSNMSSLVTLKKLILRADGTNTFNNTFNYLYNLENIVVEGKIGSSFNMQWSSKLTTASIVSVVEALSEELSGQTATLSKAAVDNLIFPFTSEQSGNTYNSWSELIAPKTNWTISLL